MEMFSLHRAAFFLKGIVKMIEQSSNPSPNAKTGVRSKTTITVINNAQKRRYLFGEKLNDCLTELTFRYFSRPLPKPGLIPQLTFSKNELGVRISTHPAIRKTIDEILSGAQNVIGCIKTTGIPAEISGQHQKYSAQKVNRKSLEEFLHSYETEFNHKMDEAELKNVRQIFLDEATIDRYYQTFEQRIHLLLNKLVRKFFPETKTFSNNALLALANFLYPFASELSDLLIEISEDSSAEK